MLDGFEQIRLADRVGAAYPEASPGAVSRSVYLQLPYIWIAVIIYDMQGNSSIKEAILCIRGNL